jgi:serine/threonine protein kinase
MTEFEQQLKDVLSQAYDIERELGGGGMSRVFVATDRVLGRKIVIKLLSPELTADVNRGRFRREIQVAAQLQHPHIVPLLSAGEHGDLVYYTMPFIAGESLKHLVERNGPMLVPDVLRVMYHVGEALDYAHNAGVIHRDIKPANILRSGTYALITDFGVAKALNASMPTPGMTSTGMAIGTPAYMAPEQLAGDQGADHRIDIYALGLLAYELLNGRSPYAGTTPKRVLVAVLTEDPPLLIDVRPDVPRRLSEIVMSCLAKEPGDRPATARELLNELDSFSTASGEIRTMEHKVPRTPRTVQTPVSPTPVSTTPVSTTPVSTTRVSTTPVSNTPVSSTPAAEQPAVIEEPAPTDQVETIGYAPPKKKGNNTLVAGVVVALAVAAGAIFMLTRSSGSSDNAVPPNVTPAVTDSASVQPPPVVAGAPLPAATPESTAAAAAPKLDSQAIADSLKKIAAAKKAAAKADSVKKAAAKADSVKRAQNSTRTKARSAAIWLLADPNASKTFADGATHMGGMLGTKRTGDLQTQINALQPFLSRAGLTYAQFKDVAQEAGIKLFDEFGRMVPDSVKKLTALSY